MLFGAAKRNSLEIVSPVRGSTQTPLIEARISNDAVAFN
jgi:hypothetical protein